MYQKTLTKVHIIEEATKTKIFEVVSSFIKNQVIKLNRDYPGRYINYMRTTHSFHVSIAPNPLLLPDNIKYRDSVLDIGLDNVTFIRSMLAQCNFTEQHRRNTNQLIDDVIQLCKFVKNIEIQYKIYFI